MVVIFDLSLRQSGLLYRRPHHRFGPAIKQAKFRKLQQLTGDLRLRRERHSRIRIIPITLTAEALKFLALNVEPFLCKVAAGLAEFRRRHIALFATLGGELFFDLPFDGQTMTIPARDKISVKPRHLF